MVSAWTRRVRADVMASLPGGPAVTAAVPAASPALSGPADDDGILGWQVAVKTPLSPRWHLAHTDLMTAEEAKAEAKSWRKHGHQAKPVEVRTVPR